MARSVGIYLFLFISWQLFGKTTPEREVLIRDRLVLVLCDQIDEYLTTGNMPPAVKKMPDKYKKVKPGGGVGKMDGFKVVIPDGKRKRQVDYNNHPILDLLYV